MLKNVGNVGVPDGVQFKQFSMDSCGFIRKGYYMPVSNLKHWKFHKQATGSNSKEF